MSNQTTDYPNHEAPQLPIKQLLPKLVKLKASENRCAFNQLLFQILPETRKYVVENVRDAIYKNQISNNNYDANNFLENLFTEVYYAINQFHSEDEFYLWLYKKNNELLNEAISDKEFDDLFYQNINDVSKKKRLELQEKVIAKVAVNNMPKENCKDISNVNEIYKLNDVFTENMANRTVKKMDETLSEAEVNKHIQLELQNLPIAVQNAFELFAKKHFALSEIAKIRNTTVEKAQKLINAARRDLKFSFFNRYDFD